MLNKDFDSFYKKFNLESKCTQGFCDKQIECIKAIEDDNFEPGGETCKKCWREYIEQQEPEECTKCNGYGYFPKCNHPGCYNHASHPYEGCGRMQGKCNHCNGTGLEPEKNYTRINLNRLI